MNGTEPLTAPGAAREPAAPVRFDVTRGGATPEELAALVAVLTALPRTLDPGPVPPVLDAWNDRGRRLSLPPVPGPGTWRACALPR
ncbi:acyl-CoA carboxylase subunit epsilon [Streptomyces sp. SL13]|uniref:Acyl-CoA carboxylase subunit epsilon n=1 Tax=Streptantibioticus silvisoli TaxID=2705255 RepID=A0AA90HF43_9ACTN|nr:acyl-CoA carboxylase subunit epsilon [Streptantibioticus silvisoli]MDI5974555.1 acyl-CoA carboxylase subunit epsilon [Streptantibioticus silvisoli]